MGIGINQLPLEQCLYQDVVYGRRQPPINYYLFTFRSIFIGKMSRIEGNLTKDTAWPNLKYSPANGARWRQTVL